VEENLPYLKKIYMTGGEPTLIKRNLEFLRRCKELGFASQIEIFFSLNLTQLEDDFLDCLHGFRKVRINGSIDGYGAANDYIRFPSRWKDVDSNLRKLASLESLPLEVGTSTVIQPYNILDLPKLFSYLEDVNKHSKNKLLIDSLFCTHPDFLDVQHFPAQLKEVALQQLREYRRQSALYRSISKNGFFFRNGLDSIVNRLESSLQSLDTGLVREFQTYTRRLDRFRKQDFSKVFPQTAAILSEAGFPCN
jgi:sulfatase maturation enzyme AslB (radical SAM superfamily)